MDCPAKKPISNLNSPFCIQMANQVILKQIAKGSNLVLSPLSFHVMLSLIAAGSTGRTLEQLLSHLESTSIDDLNKISSQIVALTSMHSERNDRISSLIVSFANGLWVDRSFTLKPSFEKIVKGVYKAEGKEVDFANKADQVIEEVNSWVENATEGLIKKLLASGSLDSDTALVFANALYFKGKWDRKFDKTQTKHREFHLLDGQVISVPFMTSKRYERHLYGSFDGYKILSIPYQTGQDTRQFSMYFFLPDDNTGLPNLVEKFNSNPGFLTQQFGLWKEDLPKFWIPRFKFSFEFEASETVKEMGLVLPFTSVGEFTEMVVDSPHSNKLYLSKVFHKSYIEVNEEGTEAAASTAPTFVKCCARFPTPSFVADHPFMFMIREETSGIVFFTRAVLNPLLVA
ncbi:Serpin-ZX like [Actinidia chinensis var. chinensis]|uniref:Serpin-ZX like n=1 Tax=Actinidia chinensis var. chinensis TaxID=1590841 RepID=A0A2R6P9U6_ACTCC|nr:Serpin-ZX like [Actinidia chinensis var. chinensis]